MKTNNILYLTVLLAVATTSQVFGNLNDGQIPNVRQGKIFDNGQLPNVRPSKGLNDGQIPNVRPYDRPNTDLIKSGTTALEFTNAAEYQKFVNIANAISAAVAERTNAGTSLGDTIIATLQGTAKRVIFNPASGSDKMSIGEFELLQRITPLQFQNQQQFAKFFRIAHKLNNRVAERTGMGLTQGEHTLATFGDKRVVLLPQSTQGEIGIGDFEKEQIRKNEQRIREVGQQNNLNSL